LAGHGAGRAADAASLVDQTRTRNAGLSTPDGPAGITLLAAFFAARGGGYWLRSADAVRDGGVLGRPAHGVPAVDAVIGIRKKAVTSPCAARWKTGVNAKFLVFF